MKCAETLGADVEPGSSGSKADRAYAYIRHLVLERHHLPGDRLVIERLAREMEISVVPVREAIRRLEAEGYVTYTRNVGATITAIDLGRYRQTVETVAVLEGVAIGLAAAHLTAKDMKEARALNERMRACIKAMDTHKFTTLSHQFHRVLYRRCPNSHLLNMVVKEWDLLASTRKSAFPFIPEQAIGSVSDHEQLLQLIESGASSEEVEAFARHHRIKTVAELAL